MRKIYLMVVSVVLSSSVFAQDLSLTTKQKSQGENAQKVGPQVKKSSKTNNSNKSLSLWTDDFSDVTKWTIASEQGPGVWTIGTSGPAGQFAIPAIASTSFGNGFALFDSDLDCSTNQIANITTTSSINLTGSPSVQLRFEQYYRRFTDSTFVFVSNDSINWTKFSVNTSLVNNEFSANNQLINPDVQEINISSVAGNQATVWIRFQFYSPNTLGALAGCAYAWMIDDVSIEVPPQIEAGLSDIDFPSSGCNLSNNATIKAFITNNGVDTITGFNANYLINNNAPVIEPINVNILPGATLEYSFVQKADFSGLGTYQLSVYISDLIGDSKVSNDSLFVQITNNIPIDVTPFYSQGFEPQEDLQGWTVADLNADGVTWDLINTFPRSGGNCLRKAGSATADNDWVFTNCINLQSGKNYNMVFYTKVFDLIAICDLKVAIGTENNEAAMGNVLYTRPAATDTSYLQVIVPITVPTTGVYYIGFNAFSAAGTSSIRIDDFSLTDGPLGTDSKKLDAEVVVYPNPSSGSANVSIRHSKSADYTITVTDVLGRTVKTMQANNIVSSDLNLDLTTVSNGVYTVKVESGSGVNTQKLIINR